MGQNSNITICGQQAVYTNGCCCGCQDKDVLDDLLIDATVDNTTGIPSVNVVKEDKKYTFNFTGLKGNDGIAGADGADGSSLTFDDLTEEQKASLKGERGPQGNDGVKGDDGERGPKGHDGIDGAPGTYPQLRAQANIGNTVGNPSVRVTVEGTTDDPIFNFYFDGLKGAAGANGTNGTNGRDGRDGIDGINGVDGIDASAEDIERAVRNEIEGQLDDLDNKLLTVSWLKYAIDGYENNKEAFARVIAAAREYDSTGKTKLQDAYAGVNALVTKNNNGTYTATSFLTSLVGSGNTTSQSGVITTANLAESIADMYATYDTNTGTAVARIFAIANQQGSNISLNANQISLNNTVHVTQSGISSGDPLNITSSEDITIKSTSGDEDSDIIFKIKRENEDTNELEELSITVSDLLEMKAKLDAMSV